MTCGYSANKDQLYNMDQEYDIEIKPCRFSSVIALREGMGTKGYVQHHVLVRKHIMLTKAPTSFPERLISGLEMIINTGYIDSIHVTK